MHDCNACAHVHDPRDGCEYGPDELCPFDDCCGGTVDNGPAYEYAEERW